MKLDIKPTEYFSLASITSKKSEIVKAVITIDTHTEQTLTSEAIHYLYADILLSGAGKYSRDEFLEAVNMLGASIEVDVTDGRVSFALRSTASAFSKLLNLFQTILQEPTFSSKELKRVKSTSLNQLHQAKENSKGIALDELRNIFYGSADRKYTYSIDDSMKEVPKITTGQVKKFHRSVMENPWFASIAGDTTTVNQLEKSLKKLKHSVQLPVGIHQPKPPQPTLALKNIPSRQNIDLGIGLPLPITRTHPDFIPLVFATAILGKWGGFAGRLMNTIREKEGLTYGIYAQLEGFTANEQGYFRIMTFFAPDKTILGLTSTFREIKKLYTGGVSQAEVIAFQTILTTQQALVHDSLSRMLADLHAYHCEGFTVAEMLEYKKTFTNVTRAEINAVIKSYLDPALMSVSGAGPTEKVYSELKKWMDQN